MRFKWFKSFTVLKLLKELNETKDSKAYSECYDKLLCVFMSPVLFVCSLLIAFFGKLYLFRSTSSIIFESITMFIFAVAFEVLLRVKIKSNIRHQIISILYNLVFFFCVVRYYHIVGPALWTFGFIQILLSISQNSRTMLVYSALTLIISGLYVNLFPAEVIFEVNIYYVVTQYALFALMFGVAKAVFSINNNHIQKVDNKIEELESEIKERKKVEAKNLHLAFYDQLTKLPNRLLFCDRLGQAIEFSERNKLEIYILFIDIDFFKLINDSLGHGCGDELLKQIGNRLSSVLRASDAASRVSGDEFLIMLQDVKSIKQVHKVADRILSEINTPFDIEDNNVTVSCSIGISKYPEDGKDCEDLIKHADIAMYKAKQDGKNRSIHYSESMEKLRLDELELINSLQSAIINQEFELYYQPQVNGKNSEVIGFEALIRWMHPEKGMISPNDFIPAAEKSGLIVPIGDWVMHTACMQNKKWQDEGQRPVPMAVNISINQITDDSLYELVKCALEKSGLDAKYLEIEITETILVEEADVVSQNLYKIRDLGVKIAIDDFGTGYSAIQYLKSFPIDRIKIPMNFIQGISQSEKDESIITVMLALADSLDIDVVAEGVETDNQFDFLMNRFCSTIQGYLFSRPLSADDVAKYAFSDKEKE